MTDPAVLAREYVLDSHAETVETVLRCADAVAEGWDRNSTAESTEIATPLRAELEAVGAWARLPDVLAGAVRAAGYSLSASPVAAPPYVTATSRGPLLRATLTDGRLVVLLHAFEIERGDGDRGDQRNERDDRAESGSGGDENGSGDDGNGSGGDENGSEGGGVRYVRGPTTPERAVRASFE